MFNEQLLLPLVIMGLVVATLVVSGLTSRHQQHLAARRSIVQRMETAIRRVESALDSLVGVPLGPELRQILRRDVRDRYRMIGDLVKSYPGLATHLQLAETRLNAEGSERMQDLSVPADEAERRKMVHALDDLRDYLELHGTLHPISVQQRQGFARLLGECAAELLASHCRAEVGRLVEEQRLEEARDLLVQLMAGLTERGLESERARELYCAAEAAINGDGSASSMTIFNRQAS